MLNTLSDGNLQHRLAAEAVHLYLFVAGYDNAVCFGDLCCCQGILNADGTVCLYLYFCACRLCCTTQSFGCHEGMCNACWTTCNAQ